MLKLLIPIFCLCQAFVFSATFTWNGASTQDRLWSTPENWVDGSVPTASAASWVAFDTPGAPVCLIDSTVAAVGGITRIGIENGPVYLEMTGGSLETLGTSYQALGLGWEAGSEGILNMRGGTITTAYGIFVGRQGTGRFNMYGGDVIISDPGNPIGVLQIPSSYSPEAVLCLYGGNIECNGTLSFSNSKGLLDIATDGKLTLSGDVRSDINNFVASGNIITYGGDSSSSLNVTYDNVNDKTILTASIASPGQAWGPKPQNSEDNIAVDSDMLSWQSGVGAVNHYVYFGTDYNAVMNANTLSPEYLGSTNELYFEIPEALSYATEYFWRVDEEDESTNVVKGDIWSFTAITYKEIDDFEQYSSTAELQNVWSSNGAETSLNTELFDSESNSMKLVFENASSASRTMPVSDLTLNGIEALTVSVHGDIANGANANQVYVELEDSVGSSRIYYDGDPNDFKQEGWEPWKVWNIELSDFTGIDLTNATALTFGIEGANSDTLYIDSIRLYTPRCVPELSLSADVNGDCEVNIDDLKYLSNNWTSCCQIINAQTPAHGPVLHYAFDETSGSIAADSADIDTSDYSGTITDGESTHWDSQGVFGGCFNAAGEAGISIPRDVFGYITDKITLSMWLYGDPAGNPVPADSPTYIISGRYSQPSFYILNARVPNNYGDVFVSLGYNDGDSIGQNDAIIWDGSTTADWEGQWNHYAFVKDATTGELGIYCNGILVAQDYEAYRTLAGLDDGGYICLAAKSDYLTPGVYSNFYDGKIDDFRMYDYALTQAEILNVAGIDHVYQPLLDSVADPSGDGKVDLKDFALIADAWMQELLWPR
jgi:hypothetical protein